MKTKKDTEGTELKVLVLEDSTRDLELMREQLSNAGYRLDVTHVENETSFTASLRENSFDLILADFKLPGFDAFGALQISRELSPQTPFICVSGTIGEETAVELLKLGAVDYVFKDRPDRLPMAVKRALKEAEVKAVYQKTLEALHQSEKHNAFLAQTAFELVELTSIQQIYKYTVQKIYELFEGNSVVALVEYDQRGNSWKMQHIEGVGKKAAELSGLLGFDINKLEGEISTKYIEQITSGKVAELDLDFPTLFNNKLSAAIGSAVKKMLSVEKMYCIAFQQDKQIIGNITFITNKKTGPINARLIEAFIHQVTNFIKKQKAEKRLEESEDRFKKLASFTFEGIVIHNNAIAIDVNHSTVELLGYERNELIGMNLLNTVHPDSHALVKDNLAKQVATPYQIVLIRKDGSTFDAEIESKSISYNGEFFRVACIRNITERKQMLDELVAAKEKAEKSDRLKTAFLQNISHEIRTPLNGILGFGELLSEMDFPREKTKEMMKNVRQSSKRLTDTITDYIDMASVVSGTMEVHKKEFPIQPLIEEVIKEATPLCEAKKIALKTSTSEKCTSIRPFSDSDIIRKTINILLNNALKFTYQGEIICGCRIIPEYLEFYVQDTGVGIANEKLEMIFDMFAQEDTSDTRGYEGSGLGLSIARGMVKLLGGVMSVTSEKSKGSTFSFTVPYIATTISEKAPPAEKNSDILAGKPLVLVAEDEESNYLYMEMVLQQAGCDYLLANNGEEAVACCKQYPNISLVLMDIKMPVMNGVEATKRIREFRPKLPIIATTAYALAGDEQRFLAAGCDGYLPKPIRMEELLAVLKVHL